MLSLQAVRLVNLPASSLDDKDVERIHSSTNEA